MSQTLLAPQPVSTHSFPAAPLPAQENALGPRWLAPLVLLTALAAAASIYTGFWHDSRDLWWGIGHDRHAHYMYGLAMAFDLRSGDVVRLFHDFDRIRVWGVLHPILIALLEAVGGPDYRLAVLPSLCGWVLTMWFAFLIPRRLLSSGGNAAGLLAAFFVLISPAHRAYATDVMYESLGAGLSLAVLHAYLVALQEPSRRAALWLGVSLSLLFLHKYNYWLLAVFGLTLGEFARQPGAWLQYARSLCQRDRLPRWVLAEIKHPLNWIALALTVAAVAVAVTGGGEIPLGRWTLSMQGPHNLIHLAYIAFFSRVALWWWRTGRTWSLELPPNLRTFLLCHGGLVGCWFLLPKRLSYFIWFVSPANSAPEQRDAVRFMHGLPYYLQGIAEDYLTLSDGIYLFGGMLVLSLLAWRKLRPGVTAVMIFLLIAAYLTCQHPMLKNRHMHSWIAAAWVLGAVGLVSMVQRVAGSLSMRLAPWAGGGVCALIIGWHSPALLTPGHAQEGGVHPEQPSPLVLTETYLPALANAKSPTILSNVSARFLWTWTFLEHHHHVNMAAELKNFKSFENNPDHAKHWLSTTRSDALVLIDIRPDAPYYLHTKENVDLAALHNALAETATWTQTQRWELPEGAVITLWRKTASAAR